MIADLARPNLLASSRPTILSAMQDVRCNTTLPHSCLPLSKRPHQFHDGGEFCRAPLPLQTRRYKAREGFAPDWALRRQQFSRVGSAHHQTFKGTFHAPLLSCLTFDFLVAARKCDISGPAAAAPRT